MYGSQKAVVDETADIERAAAAIVGGASFDNNIVCVDEKEVIAVESIVDDLIQHMGRHGARVLNERELHKVTNVIFSEYPGRRQRGTVEKDLIGKNASEILARAGIASQGDPRLIVARVTNGHPLIWTEQMMPVLPVNACAMRSATSFMKRASSPLASHSASAPIAPSISARSSISLLA